MGGAKNVILGE